MQMRIQTMLEEFEQERASLDLDKQAITKVMNEKLDKEREAMTSFKVRRVLEFKYWYQRYSALLFTLY